MKNLRIAVILLGAVVFLNSNVLAEENPFSVDFKAKHVFKSEVRAQDGEIEVTKLSLRIGYHHQKSDNLPFDINIGPDHYIFIEKTPVDIPAEAKSRGIRLKTEFNIPLVNDNRYSWGVELNPTFQTAKDVSFDSDGFRFNFSSFLAFRGDNNFMFVIGAKIRPEYEMVVLPIFGFNYQVNDRLAFNLVSDNPNIAYKITEKTKAILDFDYTFEEFEVTKGALDGSILQLQDFSTGVGIEHHFKDNISASFGVGGEFNRIIKYQDSNGKVVPEDGLYINAKLYVSF